MYDSRIEYLFREYSNDVHNFLVYFTRNRDVDDLVQDTFLNALRGIRNFRGRNPRAWLIAIARNVALDQLRKAKKVGLLDYTTLEQLPANGQSPDVWFEVKEDHERVLGHLHTMKPSHRNVLICRAIMNMTSEETGIALGWSRGRVDVTLHRAIKHLRVSMERELGVEKHDMERRR